MLILSRVCADFRNREGQTVFRIGPKDRLAILEAPEAIRSDPLFAMLMAEGSIEAVQSIAQQKRLEANPLAGTDAGGGHPPAPAPAASAEAWDAGRTDAEDAGKAKTERAGRTGRKKNNGAPAGTAADAPGGDEGAAAGEAASGAKE